MPYITYSRTSIGSSQLSICNMIGNMFESSIVVRRGKKSIAKIATDALSKGYTKVILLTNSKSKATCADIIKITDIYAMSYLWGKRYQISISKEHLEISCDDHEARDGFIKEGSE